MLNNASLQCQLDFAMTNTTTPRTDRNYLETHSAFPLKHCIALGKVRENSFFFFFFFYQGNYFFVSCYGECVTDMITSQLISNTYSGMVTLKDGSFTPMNIEYSACMHVIHNRKMNITTIFRIISLF